MPNVDWHFLFVVALTFATGAVSIGIGVIGFRKGKVLDKAGYRCRKETPIMFMLTVAAWTGMGTAMLLVSVWAALG